MRELIRVGNGTIDVIDEIHYDDFADIITRLFNMAQLRR